MFRRFAVSLLFLLVASPLLAATRITQDVGGKPTPLSWDPTAFPLRYEIDSRVAALSPGAVQEVTQAYDAWTRIPEANIRFQSEGVVAGAAEHSAGRSVVSVADDLLRGQGALAITSYSWDVNTGRMLDADIRVDPSLFDGHVNAEMALEHEVGHLLGLDHSAVLSSVMYPWIGGTGSIPDFDSDERIAISAMYPAGDPMQRGAMLQGKVLGDEGGILAAQVVALNERGQPVGTVLTDETGEFSLSGIPPGRYRLYAEPLDGPVVVDALQGTWRDARTKPFPTRFFGPPMDVQSGRIYGNLILNTAGPVELNPRVVGRADPRDGELSLTTTPVSVRPGETVRLAVGGDGFTSGMTQMEVLNPQIKRISDFEWWDGLVVATYQVDPAAAPSSAVILVRSGNSSAMLTGALRIPRQQTKSRAVRQ